MIGKIIGSKAAFGGRRAEARKARALINYAIDLMSVSDDIDLGLGRQLRYAADLHNHDRPGEKVRSTGRRNLVGSNISDIQAEMMSVLVQGRCKKSPVVHLVLSWRDQEDPTDAQVEECVSIVMDDLGGPDLQVVWAVHQNTCNTHVHLIINRVRPSDFSTCELWNGWAIDGLHRSIARIESRQGWAAEPGALYEVTAAGEIRHRASGHIVQSSAGQQLRTKGHRAREAQIKRQSLPTSAATEIIAAKSWAELHQMLAAHGITYWEKGSGAILRVVGHQDIKLSTAVKGSSHSKLVARLGAYQPAATAHAQAEHGYAAYRRELRAANDRVRAHRRAVWNIFDRAHCDLQFPSDEEPAHDIADRTRRAIATEYQAARERLRAEYDRLLLQLAVANFPNSEEWEKRGRPDVPPFRLPSLITATIPDRGERAAPAGYIREQHLLHDTYTRVGSDAGPTITDIGAVIIVMGDEVDLLAALRMGCERWGQAQVTATEASCLMAEKLARDHGLHVVTKVIGTSPPAGAMGPQKDWHGRTAPATSLPDRNLLGNQQAQLGAPEKALPATLHLETKNERKLDAQAQSAGNDDRSLFRPTRELLELFQSGLVRTTVAARRNGHGLRDLPPGEVAHSVRDAGLLLPDDPSVQDRTGLRMRWSIALDRSAEAAPALTDVTKSTRGPSAPGWAAGFAPTQNPPPNRMSKAKFDDELRTAVRQLSHHSPGHPQEPPRDEHPSNGAKAQLQAAHVDSGVTDAIRLQHQREIATRNRGR